MQLSCLFSPQSPRCCSVPVQSVTKCRQYLSVIFRVAQWWKRHCRQATLTFDPPSCLLDICQQRPTCSQAATEDHSLLSASPAPPVTPHSCHSDITNCLSGWLTCHVWVHICSVTFLWIISTHALRLIDWTVRAFSSALYNLLRQLCLNATRLGLHYNHSWNQQAVDFNRHKLSDELRE